MAINGTSVSVLVNWYKETSFLDLMWGSLKDFIDEVVVIAGPYEYLRPVLEGFDLPLIEQDAEAIFQTATGATNIKFLHGPWISEDAKRIAGYEQCTGDIILSIDSDEIVDLDISALSEFIESQFSVSQMNVINIATHRFLFGSNSFDYESDFPKKTICFKRNQVSANSHLNYLWLVGVSQTFDALLPSFPRAIGLMFHATGIRNLDDQFTRTIFYQALWHETDPRGDTRKFLSDANHLAGNKIGYLARTQNGIGLNLASYSTFPEAFWLVNPLWKQVIERGERHVKERWSTAIDVSVLPKGNHYFISLEQVVSSLHTGTLNQSDLENQSFLCVKSNGTAERLTFNLDLLNNFASTDIVHGFVQLLI